jgi:hypothetical protein
MRSPAGEGAAGAEAVAVEHVVAAEQEAAALGQAAEREAAVVGPAALDRVAALDRGVVLDPVPVVRVALRQAGRAAVGPAVLRHAQRRTGPRPVDPAAARALPEPEASRHSVAPTPGLQLAPRILLAEVVGRTSIPAFGRAAIDLVPATARKSALALARDLQLAIGRVSTSAPV